MGNASQIGSAGLGATAGGSLMSGFGALASGFSNKSMYDYQSGVAQLKSQIDQWNAESARQTGEVSSLSAGLQQGQQFGKIIAAQSASGLDIRSGSNKQVQDSTRQINQLDTDIIRSNAAKTAYGYETESVADQAQANVYSMAGNNSLAAGFMGLGTSIMGGISSVSNEWLQGNRVGLWNGTQSNSSGAGGIGSDYVAGGAY